MRILKELVTESHYKFIKKYLKSIEKINIGIDEVNGMISFPENAEIQQSAFNEQYIGYLSDYNNNIITFRKPVKIEVPVDDISFLRLFEKYVDTEKPFVETFVKWLTRITCPLSAQFG